MSKELKVVYENIKTKYKVIPVEMVIEKDKIKYKRAKKKEKDRELAKDYLGSERWKYIVYMIWKTMNNACGVFLTRKEVAIFFNTDSNSIGSSICRKERRNHRYLIERVEYIEDD